MKAAVILLSFLLFWQPTHGQFVDSFDDGNLVVDPEWSGTASDFWVESQVLKLNAPPISGTSYLSTPSSSINNATWQFDVILNFNPSSSNYLKVYLVSDQADLTLDLNGYYIQIGGTPDEVSLYHQSVDGIEKIIDGLDGRLNTSLVELSIRATRDYAGNWALFSLLTSETNWYQEGIVQHNDQVSSSFFGVVCTYTSTRSTKFSFDNFSVLGNPYTDTFAPELTGFQFLNTNQLRLNFDESVDSISSVNTDNYLLNNIDIPEYVSWQDTSVVLTFNSSFELTNTLSLSDIRDLSFNPMDSTFQMVYVDATPPQPGDIVINELMPDPTPREDLPESEFIELLNNSNKVINLQGWSLSDLVSTAVLAEYLLFPDSIIIICAKNDRIIFEPFGAVLTVSNWPSLNNAGDMISLKEPAGTIIDQVNYSPNWFHDESKKDGGWSLELIFPKHNCSSEANWTASTDVRGGTPGKPNTVFIPEDNTAPWLISQQIYSDSLNIIFSETVQISQAQLILIPKDAGLTIHQSDNWLTVRFDQSLKRSEPFLLIINAIQDCNGNSSEVIELEFVIPDTPGYADVVINEILFNPRVDAVDFIELYNTSDKYYDLSGWTLSNGNQTKILEAVKLLTPKSYLVLTADVDILGKEYPTRVIESFLETALPAMNNDQGSIAIMNNEGDLLDSMFYSETQHFELINDVEGVSLERVSANVASTIRGNWQSAASTVGFATPGYENSQASLVEPAEDNFSVDPVVIVPDNNGVDDFTTLYYEFDQSGYIANIDVYNLNGHVVKEIANNESLGQTGLFTWNGTNNQGNVVSMGHYIIVVELFNAKGQKKIYRHKVVVGTIF